MSDNDNTATSKRTYTRRSRTKSSTQSNKVSQLEDAVAHRGAMPSRRSTTTRNHIGASIRCVCGLPPNPRVTTPANGARTSNGRNAGHRSARVKRPPRWFLEVRQRTARIRTTANTPPVVRGCCSRAAMPCSMPPRWTATPRKLNPTSRCRTHRTRGNVVPVNIGATVRNGGNRAYYAPGTDHIQMPPFAAFVENVSYYSTLAHEHTHWTASLNGATVSWETVRR